MLSQCRVSFLTVVVVTTVFLFYIFDPGENTEMVLASQSDEKYVLSSPDHNYGTYTNHAHVRKHHGKSYGNQDDMLTRLGNGLMRYGNGYNNENGINHHDKSINHHDKSINHHDMALNQYGKALSYHGRAFNQYGSAYIHEDIHGVVMTEADFSAAGLNNYTYKIALSGRRKWHTTAMETVEQIQRLDQQHKQRESIIGKKAPPWHRKVGDKLKMVCYYRLPLSDGADELQPEQLLPGLCTHLLLIGQSVIVNDTITLTGPHTTQVLARVVRLKEGREAGLKVLLCLTDGFSQLVANHTATVSFAYKARQFVLSHGLDGLDLDWEFPAWPLNHSSNQRAAFITMLAYLSTALRLVQPALEVSVAVSGSKLILERSYDLLAIARNVDFVSLMGYDYHQYQTYLPFTGHNAPLHASPWQRGFLATLNVEWSVGALLRAGVPPYKLVVGVPTYARTWRLASPRWQGVGAPAVGEGLGGGSVGYDVVRGFLDSGGEGRWDGGAGVPYAVRDKDWISYESERSARVKAAWVVRRGLAGVMTFDLNCDHWTNDNNNNNNNNNNNKESNNNMASYKNNTASSHSNTVSNNKNSATTTARSNKYNGTNASSSDNTIASDNRTNNNNNNTFSSNTNTKGKFPLHLAILRGLNDTLGYGL